MVWIVREVLVRQLDIKAKRLAGIVERLWPQDGPRAFFGIGIETGCTRQQSESILAGEFLAPDVLDDDVQFAKDLGLVAMERGGLAIGNPIYREVISRALTGVLQQSTPVLP